MHDSDDLEMPGPDEPVGMLPVSFGVPIPTPEQVAGEVARQIVQSVGYQNQTTWQKMLEAAVRDKIDELIAEIARPVLAQILAKPIQPTDGFGNPFGDPTTLHGVIASHVEHWANTPVDNNGLVKKPDSYNRAAPRINWALGQMVNGELKRQVDAEVRKISDQLKAAATSNIAKQIAEKVSGMVFK